MIDGFYVYFTITHNFGNLEHDLTAALRKKPPKVRDSITRNKLIAKGWSKIEVEMFPQMASVIYGTQMDLSKDLTLAILYRYGKILNEFDVSETASIIIGKVILDVISRHLRRIWEYHGQNYFNSQENGETTREEASNIVMTNTFIKPIQQDIDKLYIWGDAASIRFIRNELKEVIISLLLLANIPLGILHVYVDPSRWFNTMRDSDKSLQEVRAEKEILDIYTKVIKNYENALN